TEVKLVTDPLEVRMIPRMQCLQGRRQQAIVFLKCFQDRARGEVQFRQAAAVVFHLLDEVERWVVLRRHAGGRPRSNGAQRGTLPWVESQRPQPAYEPALDLLYMGLEQP